MKPLVKLRRDVHFACKTQVKDINPTDIKSLESDLTEHTTDDISVSQEDLLCLSKVKEGIKQKEDGHYELSLPFKTGKPNPPDNKLQYVQSIDSLL